jgi:acyl-CoA synthetase (AMP-forming)/AMP-acid ligase II
VILDHPADIERWREAGWWGTTTVDDLLRACVAAHPHRLALVDAPNRAAFAFGLPQRLTFAEVDACVDRLAATLFDAGVRKDGIVLVQLPNIVEIVLAFLACARLGAIVSPIMLAYGERDLRRIVTHLDPAAILTLAEFKEAQPARVAAHVVDERGGPRIPVLAFGAGEAPDVMYIAGLERLPGDVTALRRYLASITIDANEIVTMHWTSGTTGEPKCVPRNHNTWHATGGCCTDSGGLQPGERILAPMQMVHTAGFSGLLMPWLETQGLLALHHPFDMGVFLDQLEAERINHTVMAPSMLNALLKANTLDDRDVSSIRSILCGSAPLDPWMITGFKQRYGIEIVNAFGSTEGMTFMSGPTITADPYRRARYYPRFRGCVTPAAAASKWGLRIAPVVATRLRDLETGVEIDVPKQPGELLFRSPALFPGYWTAEHRLDRSDFDADGFFRAGEIFEIAGEGEDASFYHYIDRLKDVINRGGVKIPVGELEAAIQDHPAVSEAVAIGYPDERLGERICAVVALRPGATLTLEALVQHLAEKDIPRFMRPERLELVAALPRNPTGKPLKRELARQLAGAVGISGVPHGPAGG